MVDYLNSQGRHKGRLFNYLPSQILSKEVIYWCVSHCTAQLIWKNMVNYWNSLGRDKGKLFNYLPSQILSREIIYKCFSLYSTINKFINSSFWNGYILFYCWHTYVFFVLFTINYSTMLFVKIIYYLLYIYKILINT